MGSANFDQRLVCLFAVSAFPDFAIWTAGVVKNIRRLLLVCSDAVEPGLRSKSDPNVGAFASLLTRVPPLD